MRLKAGAPRKSDGPAAPGWLSLIGVVAGAGAIGLSFGLLLAPVVTTETADAISPVRCGLVAGLLALAWATVLPAALRLKVPLLPWWIGLAALALPLIASPDEPPLSVLSFERAGLLWVFGEWLRVPAGTYILLLGVGAILAAVWFAVIVRARSDRRALVFACVSSLACAGVWRSVMHPPSGDEPALLFAAWRWLETGSLDLANALNGGPAEVWSRVVEFKDELHVYHTAGLPDGPRYTVHGILLPAVFGVFLAPAGRLGLMLALTGLAGAVAWTMARACRDLTGRPVSNLWLAAVLAGSPVAVYTVFMSPDLAGAGLFALGCLGLVRRRALPLAIAVAALPWLHHKLGLTSAGLVAGAFVVSPGLGLRAAAAFLFSVIPEFLIINVAFGIPLWPPAEWWGTIQGEFTRHPHVGTYSILNWIRSVPGLLADRYAGLVWYPAWILAIAGCILASRAAISGKRGARAAAGIVAACVPYLLVLLSYDTWMGGDGAPGRMLVMIFPVLALGLATIDDGRLAAARARVLRAAVWLGVAHAQFLLYVPAVAFRSAKLKIEALVASRIGVDPLSVLPGISLSRDSGFPGWLAMIWLVVLGALVFVLARSRKSGRRV